MNKKAFTVVELMFAIAILGILMFIAKPNLMRNVEQAKLVRIKQDIKISENIVETKISIDKMPDNWTTIEPSDFNLFLEKDKIYDLNGVVDKVTKEMIECKYQKVNKDWTKSKLDGDFYTDKMAKVYYIDN